MGPEVPLLLLVAAIVVAAPILAVIAFVRLLGFERETRARLERVEQAVHALQGDATRAAPQDQAIESVAAAMPPGSRPPAGPQAAAATPRPPHRAGLDLEAWIAGRWLNRVGIVALLFAAAFFLKFAFDNDWVGARGRVAIGLVAGAVLMVWGQHLLGRGYRYFSEGITGLGGGVLYLSVYAAWSFYRLIGFAPAFAGMIVVTGALTAVALGRRSERLALLALTGGLLTPALLSTFADPQYVLFPYLVVLVAGVVALAWFTRWRSLEPVAWLGVVVHFAAWFGEYYEPAKLAATLVFATLLFVELALPALLRARRGQRLRPEQIGLVLLNAGWFVVALHAMLYRSHRWGLTFAVLALAAAYVGSAGLTRRVEATAATRQLYAGLALTLATITIPIRLEGRWIVMAWAVEAAVLVRSGLRIGNRALRAAGLVLFVLTLGWLATQPMTAERLLLNARFVTFATTVAALAVAAFLARRVRPPLSVEEAWLFGAVGIVVHLVALSALSLEVWDFCGRSLADRELARQLGLSLLWALYGAGLIVAGVRLSSAALRWQGLALLGIVVGKVFLLDLSFLERGFRILSFCVVGIVLLVISFLYQRRLAEGRSGDETP